MQNFLHLPVAEEGQAGEARRGAARWAREAGFGEELTARFTLVITELAKNLALHSAGGALLVRLTEPASSAGASILSLDKGPGSDNFGQCLRDGFSTAGTAGIGLGSVQRASASMEVHSQGGLGTAILARVQPVRSTAPAARPVTIGAIAVPCRGEHVCGDTIAELFGDGWARFLVADGLGHGPLAAEASQAAAAIFAAFPHLPLPEVLRRMHEKLRSTRGSAVAVAHLDLAKGELLYAGVGNISGTIIAGEKLTNLVSQNGTVGAAFPGEVRVFPYRWESGNLLVMHSDGLKSQWQLGRYRGLMSRHPELIAGVLYRDFNRGTDDATVLVACQAV